MDIKSELTAKIKTLSEMLWDHKANQTCIDNWFAGFDRYRLLTEEERIDLLYALSNFIYFGPKLIRELLKAAFRDLYKRPIIASIRHKHSDILDCTLINDEFQNILSNTRFLGVGNPSESGQHILYFFRQENRLPKTAFINQSEIYDFDVKQGSVSLNDPDICHYVFLDDFCGSGTQAERYLKSTINMVFSLSDSVKVSYLSLFAMSTGLSYLRSKFPRLEVSTIFELDNTFKAFHETARYFDKNSCPEEISKQRFKDLCKEYAAILGFPPEHLLGWDDSQLMIGFNHNTPDNALPVFWYDEIPGKWNPIFKRYQKVYK